MKFVNVVWNISEGASSLYRDVYRYVINTKLLNSVLNIRWEPKQPYRWSRSTHRDFSCVKPGIDWARLPRQAMFVALPRKVDTMLLHAVERTLPRSSLARVEQNWSGTLSRVKGISVCCALSVETISWLRNSADQQPHAAAALRCWTRIR
jgi:hypothetical protein